jgi:hypothetical protein
VRTLLLATLVGCSDSTTVELVAPGQPVYFKGTIDGRAWQNITGVFDGVGTHYSLAIDGDFELTMVCEHGDGTFFASQVYGTVDDAAVTLGSWGVPDCTDLVDSPVHVDVTGLLSQQGILAIGDSTLFWTDLADPFTIEVVPGVHDIAFTNTNFVVSIVHDQQIAGATDLGGLTFGSGTAMVTNGYSASLVPSETAAAFTQVETRNRTSLRYDFDPNAAVFVPPEQLAYGDTQTFYFVAQGDLTERSAIATDFDSSPSQFDLLALLDNYHWSSPITRSVTWSPTSDFYSSLFVAFTSAQGTEVATASKQWLDAHDPTTIAFDETGPPSYRWTTVNPSTTLTVELWSPGLILLSSTGQAD